MSRRLGTVPATPAGYIRERERGAVVVALPSVMEAVLHAITTCGTLYSAAQSSGAESFTGRGTAYRMAQCDGDWLVRHFRRGGAVARLLGDRYLRLGEPRPFAELRVSVTARERGVSTPEVLAAILYPSTLHYRADLATRFEHGSLDLAELTLGHGRRTQSVRLRERAWHAAGLLLRHAFDAGIEHADLNLRNILIGGFTRDTADHAAAAADTPRAADHEPGTAVRALLLDLDRAVLHGRGVSDVARERMLRRLHRSRRKLERLHGEHVTTAELSAFEEGVHG